MKRPPLRLRVFLTHPVQYHAPIWRLLAQHPELDIKVFYFNDRSVRGGFDREFGVNVAWDVDLLGGYRSSFLSRDAPLDRPQAMRISRVDALLREEAPDWLLFAGYTHGFERQLARRARSHGARVLMRGEFCDLSLGQRSIGNKLVRKAYLRWFYSHIDRFCFIGEHARRHLQSFGVEPERMFFSPYSVDDATVLGSSHGQSRQQAREALGIPDNRFVFILSGKLIPRKDPFAVLNAIRLIRDPGRVGLVVLGDGELKESFVREAQTLLGSRLVYPGFVNQTQLGKFFAASDALVMPSLFETWGLVVNEAMHHGLPCVVSSQVGCAPDLIRDGSTGFVYPSGDLRALASSMQRLVDDELAARTMGQQARALIEGYTTRASARGVVESLGLAS